MYIITTQEGVIYPSTEYTEYPDSPGYFSIRNFNITGSIPKYILARQCKCREHSGNFLRNFSESQNKGEVIVIGFDFDRNSLTNYLESEGDQCQENT